MADQNRAVRREHGETIFFVNWWGRPDFKDHVYTKIGEPDPDTGYDFGVNCASRKIVAWGGTTPDDEETGLGASASNGSGSRPLGGPEPWGGNFDITNDDLDGDDEPTTGCRRRGSTPRAATARRARSIAIWACSRATRRSTSCSPPSPLYPPDRPREAAE